jgi:RND family efflux transporter MFP subunit
VAGKLANRPVNAGDTVQKGQLLAQLDAEDLQLAQAQGQAALSQARTNHDQALSDFRRYKELREQGFIGGAELERREATLKGAKAQLDQAEAQWGVQRNQASYAKLLADAPGIVTAVDAEPGQVLAAGSPVLKLARNGPRDAVFAVPEDDAPAFRALVGKIGALTLQLWGETRSLPAKVREVAGAADPVTRTFLVKAEVQGEGLRLGQTATVSVMGTPLPGTARLPLSAIFEREGVATVWLLDKEKMIVKAQPVQMGAADGNAVIVKGGLRQGDEVIVAGTHLLTPGQAVTRFVEASGRVAPSAATEAASR